MAKPKLKKKLYRFYGFYNNVCIGTKTRLNNVKIVLHEQRAINLEEAIELYKLFLIHKVGVSENNIDNYLIDLYYDSIKVEVIDNETTEYMEINLISK